MRIMKEKIRILALITVLGTASFINQVQAQNGPVFNIPLYEDKTAVLAEIAVSEALETKNEPKAEPKEAINPEILKQQEILAIRESDIQKLLSAGFKADFYDAYKDAAEKYGLDWQILAAVHKVETGQNGDTARKSSAGAGGPMQFMPSTFRAYAVDGNGDGVLQMENVHDAIYTAANYLATNKNQKDITFALFRYNHSQSYVNKVKALASSIN